jgi:hypothetical protein
MNESHGVCLSFSDSTFRRVKQSLKDTKSIVLRCTKTKSLATCRTCNNFDESIKSEKDPELARAFSKAKGEHLKEVDEHRKWVDRQKSHALRTPFKTWTLLIDGMDSSKTKLPHLAQPIKGVEMQVDVRVVGGLMFGAPIPVQAVTCLDDVSVKGANASITHIEMMLDNQFMALDPSDVQPLLDPMPGRPGAVMLSADRAKELSVEFNEVDRGFQLAQPVGLKSDGVPQPHARDPDAPPHAAAASSTPPRYPTAKRFPFYWPEHLSLVVDNTAADYKNSAAFHFLGVLVALCVFSCITVATLIVGHTHDIVDAMFGVWARKLAVADALSLSLLHALFRKEYATRIYEIDEKAKEAKETGSSKQSQAVHSMLGDLAKELGVDPLITRQTFCVEHPLFKAEAIPGISPLHCFSIERELDTDDSVSPSVMREAVLLKSRHVAVPQAGGLETYEVQGFQGPYTACLRLFWVDEVVASVERDEVLRSPGFRVPADQLLKQLKSDYNYKFTADNKCFEEWQALLTPMKSTFDADMAACETLHVSEKAGAVEQSECAFLRGMRESVGTLHRPDSNATEAERTKYKEASDKKSSSINQLRSHLFDAPHRHLILTDWLRKWKQRADLIIKPYYRARGVAVDLQPVPGGERREVPLGRSVHPAAGSMPHNRHRGKTHRRNTMEESQAKNNRLQPKQGDLLVLRGPPWYPMFVGEVLPVEKLDRLLGAMLRRWRNRQMNSSAASSKKRRFSKVNAAAKSSTPAAAAAHDAPCQLGHAVKKRRTRERVNYAGLDVDSEPNESDGDHAAVDEFNDRPDLDNRGYKSESDDVWQSLDATTKDDESVIAARKRQLQNKIAVRWYAFNTTKRNWDDEKQIRDELKDPNDLALWQDACAAAYAGGQQFRRLPEHAVTRWKSVKWVTTQGIRLDENIGFVDPAGIIQFGPEHKMLTKSGKTLQAHVLNAAVADLCEIGEQMMDGAAAAAVINGAAAAAAAVAVPMDDGEEKE